jgi:hypothetical protein
LISIHCTGFKNGVKNRFISSSDSAFSHSDHADQTWSAKLGSRVWGGEMKRKTVPSPQSKSPRLATLEATKKGPRE